MAAAKTKSIDEIDDIGEMFDRLLYIMLAFFRAF